MVVRDDLVEQHQVEIIPCAALDIEGRLGVAQHRIREVADETARERRLTLKPRCAVLAEHLAENGERLVGLDRLVDRTLERYRAVFAGRTQNRVIAEEGVARPFFAALHALQQEKAVGTGLQAAQQRNRRCHIGVDLAADRNGRIFLRELQNLVTAWGNHCVFLHISAFQPNNPFGNTG